MSSTATTNETSNARLSCRGRNCLCTHNPKNAVSKKAQGEDSDADQSGFQTRTEEDRSEESYKLTSSGS
jgi:hypothetical protein